MRIYPFIHKIQKIWTNYDETQMHFHKIDFLTCQTTPQFRAKSNIVKHFVVRNDEKRGPTYQRDPRRNNATHPAFFVRRHGFLPFHVGSGTRGELVGASTLRVDGSSLAEFHVGPSSSTVLALLPHAMHLHCPVPTSSPHHCGSKRYDTHYSAPTITAPLSTLATELCASWRVSCTCHLSLNHLLCHEGPANLDHKCCIEGEVQWLRSDRLWRAHKVVTDAVEDVSRKMQPNV